MLWNQWLREGWYHEILGTYTTMSFTQLFSSGASRGEGVRQRFSLVSQFDPPIQQIIRASTNPYMCSEELTTT